ncbi:MAG TPA: nuclear transport factor 2 family protein [Gemmatimonadales bacterium]
MKRLLAIGALAMAACSPGAGPDSLSSSGRASIVDSVQATLTAWTGAINRRDFGAASRFYTTDSSFRWIEDGQVRYRKAAEIRSAMESMAPLYREIAFNLTDVRVTPLSPGVATVTTEFTQKMTDTLGAVDGYAGAISMTMVDGPDGWRFLVGHTSSMVPAPTGPLVKLDSTP